MESTVQGVIRGTRIDLDQETNIPSGSRVKLQIRPVANMSDAEKLRRILKLFKALGRDKTLIKALESAYRSRQGDLPRKAQL